MYLWPVKQNRFFFIFFLSAIILAFFVFSNIGQAANSAGGDAALNGLNQAAGKAFLDKSTVSKSDTGIIQSIPETIGTVVGAGLALIGVIFLILMIYGGFTWMMARGNEQQVTKAKDLIFAAIIGLFIVLAAYAITAYIGESFLK
jgi:hypothetical protein